VELPRTRRYEAALLRTFARTMVVAATDAAALEALAQPAHASAGRPVVALSNGVDLAYFCPDDTPRQPAELVLSGKMSYHANVTAAVYLVQEVLPLAWEKRPDLHLTIAGSAPPPTVQALSGPQVTVTGYVPDLRPFVRRAAVAVAPVVYGAGLQYKVLEAMACATPVVATPQTAAPLAARPGEEILVGASAAELAAHIVRLLDDPAAARRIGAAGRAYVERQHDWAIIAARLEELYSRIFDPQ
jgi:glycosyltransferase involved in cell wall biosynthesis